MGKGCNGSMVGHQCRILCLELFSQAHTMNLRLHHIKDGNVGVMKGVIWKIAPQVQIADLIAAVREGREPMVSGAEARHAVELILAVYKSAQTGRPVEL